MLPTARDALVRPPADDAGDAATKKALDTFIVSESFEEWVDLKMRTIGAPVLAHLCGQD